MTYLVQMYSRLREVVIDFCCKTCCAAKSCMLLSQHKIFVGCDVNCELLTAAALVKPEINRTV